MDIEEGTILVQHEGANWAAALSRRHQWRLWHDSRLSIDASLISIHYRAPEDVWGTIEGNGYCGYDTIRYILIPGAPKFKLADAGIIPPTRDTQENV